jgi:hypothetical protein
MGPGAAAVDGAGSRSDADRELGDEDRGAVGAAGSTSRSAAPSPADQRGGFIAIGAMRGSRPTFGRRSADDRGAGEGSGRGCGAGRRGGWAEVVGMPTNVSTLDSRRSRSARTSAAAGGDSGGAGRDTVRPPGLSFGVLSTPGQEAT